MAKQKARSARISRKVVIVGAGGAGLAAATAAIQTRPDIEVTVLEQNATHGGVTAIGTGTIRACESRLQKELGREGETKQDALKQYLETGGRRQDLTILDTYLEKSGGAVDWLISLGCRIELFDDFRHMIAPAKEGLPGGTGMTEVLYEAAKKGGAEFFYETKATNLITKDGKVVGVKAVTKDGKLLQFNADAVVLCDGGFWGARKGAFDKYIPPHLKDVVIMAEGSFPQGGVGDGARMAEAAGAELQNMDALAYTAQRYLNGNGSLCPMPGSATLWSDAASVILNQGLERFSNEDLCFAKETLTDEIVKELTKRREKWFWNVWDQQSRENAYRIRFWIGEGLIEQGFILVGDTIEELAGKMGTDAGKLKAAISKYNSYFEQGLEKDSEFGRNLKRNKVHPINEPPFFAMRAGLQVNNRRGGVSTDKEARALNKDKKPIPGLYVAGSSMDAVKFDGMGWLSGTGFTSCVVWGRIAGENAAQGR